MKSERGMTLIEVLIAMGIIAAVALIYLSGMSMSSKAVMVSQEQITSEALAKSQLEHVKLQPYQTSLIYDLVDYDQIPAGYEIELGATKMNPRGDSEHNDDGLQLITIRIFHNGKQVYKLQGYKVFQ